MKKFNSVKIFIIIFFSFTPFFSFAQNVADTSSGSVDIFLLPANPGPNQSVSASVSSKEFNIGLAKIVWLINDKVIKSGQGVKNIVFTSPPAGKSDVLSVIVTPPGKTPLKSEISIAPGGTVDLIWEAIDGYTPPFYKGKTLPIRQSAIKVTAIPLVKLSNGNFARADSFSYTWKKDGSSVGGQSGLGKNSIIFINQVLENENRVDVAVTNGTETVSSSIVVSPFTPEILFYEYDQSRGMSRLEKVFQTNSTINQPRITLSAEPYFLMKDWPKNNSVTFNWNLNGQQAKPGYKNTLGIITSRSGLVNVDVTYDESQKLFRNIKSMVKFNVQ